MNFLSFNGGEWSPLLHSRVDLQNYNRGCRKMLNMIPRTTGAAIRRKGFEFIAETKYADKKTRLIKFEYSTDVTYVIELGHEYARFYTNGRPVLGGDGEPVEVVTPYSEDELLEIHYARMNDVLFLAHKNTPLMLIERYAEDDWRIREADFDYPATIRENTDETRLLELSARSGTGVTMTAYGFAPFTEEHVGSYWVLRHRASYWDAAIDLTINNGNQVSGVIFAQGTVDVVTTGSWFAKIKIEQASNEEFTEGVIEIFGFDANQDKNFNTTYETPSGGAYYRVTIFDYGNSPTLSKVTFTPRDRVIDGVVKITDVNSASEAIVDVVSKPFSTGSTHMWAEGAWSKFRGFPRAISFFEERLFLAGTSYEPQTIWGSNTDDYFRFSLGDLATSGTKHVLASNNRDEIVWMCPRNGLMVGTSSSEWILSAANQEEGFSGENSKALSQSSYGSAPIQPEQTNDVIIFCQRSRRRLRESVYSFQRDGFVAADLNQIAEHITGTGVTCIAYQRHPDPILWSVNDAGELLSMVYEKNEGVEVIAWSRHETQGRFESVAVIYGSDDDEVWVSTIREIDGVERRFVERMSGYFNPRRRPPNWQIRIDPDPEWYAPNALAGGSSDVPQIGDYPPQASTNRWLRINPTPWLGTLEVEFRSTLNGTYYLGETVGLPEPSDLYICADKFANLSGPTQAELYHDIPHDGGTIRFYEWNGVTRALRSNSTPINYQVSCISLSFVERGVLGIRVPIRVSSFAVPAPENEQNPFVIFYGNSGEIIGIEEIELSSEVHNQMVIVEFVAPLGKRIRGLTVSNEFDSTGSMYPAKRELRILTQPELSLYFKVLEYPDPSLEPPVYVDGNQVEQMFVDAAKSYAGEPASIIEGLEHLEGMEVDILADGAVHPKRTVTDGKVILDHPASVVHVGLPYISELQPMSLNADPNMGNSDNQIKRIHGIGISFMDTLGCRYGDGKRFYDLQFRKTTDLMDAAPPLFTGDVNNISFGGNYEYDTELILRQEQPLPMCVRSINVKYTITGR